MKHFSRALLLLPLVGLLAAGTYSHETIQAPTQDQSAQVIDMTAKKYKFTPSPVHVKRGTKVQLRITALDHVHGFKINIYPDGADAKGAPGLAFVTPKECWRLEKGQVTTIEFVAQTPGSYPFKCCVFCGFGHMGMKGLLIVDP
ncbi:MAG TPA: cupredoxin domain-containing protein [Candidatus Acidoferrales bacterium]|nr:cupredoxin domain-containing protein [Candidatus Acidoferrales bacterium]